MFHTPPTRDTWQPDTSIKFSYDNESLDQTTAEIVKSPAIGSDRRDSEESLIESIHTATKDELPAQLLKYLQEFIRFLREPQYSKPLATFEIADLFQKFYADFHTKSTELLQSERKVELKDLNRPLNYSSSKYNLIVERQLCEKFYTSLMFPRKGVSLDEFEKKLNADFGVKLSYLNRIDITFQTLDLQLELEELAFQNKLRELILPEFEIFSAERSPTLKLKHLSKIHRLLDTLLKDMSKDTLHELNTDIYLPILIYTIIKIEDLQTHSLISQFEFIKRFRNDFVYDGLDDEKGHLLYVFTNFEASISYLASVTLENLNLQVNQEELVRPGDDADQIATLLSQPLVLESVDEQVKKVQSESMSARHLSSSSLLDSSRFSLLTPAEFLPLYHADQGIRNISNAVDSSIKSIIGRVSWFNPAVDPVLESTRQQMEENLAIQTSVTLNKPEETKITPTSSISTNDSRSQPQTGSDLTLQLPATQTGSSDGITSTMTSTTLVRTKSQDSYASSPNAQDKFFNKFTSSMGGVMKNLRPLSTSSSSSSLNVNIEPNGSVGSQSNLTLSPSNSSNCTQVGDKNRPPLNRMRSRTASLISSNIFSPEHQRMSKAALFSSIENAFENVKNRSRGNSLGEQQPSHRPEEPVKAAGLDASKLDKFGDKPFEQLTMAELAQIYDNYKYLLSMLNK
ncbi:hypothetical protein OGAPHI_004188 [Ogataea philodendri]|uniref:VPS9 domain-containing protein n=1 Tax=Ogataea philodendri TaxID=1378263 RepID=A0A9P8P7C2_9ASCO|nr:uncharacterized protein OGAPHI_004188 [Ogataea philodendri]KAH3665999.1 hypothetical protein OGAPHI_004188 [Ogataea philodendri]